MISSNASPVHYAERAYEQFYTENPHLGGSKNYNKKIWRHTSAQCPINANSLVTMFQRKINFSYGT